MVVITLTGSSYIHSVFTSTFIHYSILSIYYVSGTVLGTGNTN